MSFHETDILIVGAGPVGLMCAYLGQLCGLRTVVLDRSAGPLQVGRADALNARTLQLLETVGLFDELYPLGKPCNTSSIWADGKMISRQSSWWDNLEGCLHRHFLMLGQSYLEQLLDSKLRNLGAAPRRFAPVVDVQVGEDGCLTQLADGERIHSKFVIGADGSRSFVRDFFKIPFQISRPELVWAVIDGVIESDFPKVPEIIVFQAETSDVAWIPREGTIDRFYVRMDKNEFTLEEAVAKINRAMAPHTLKFREVVWFSQFSVKESVAERFSEQNRVFLAGDACHIHSVNGGQGLNTGLSDAFNLIWKLRRAIQSGAGLKLLESYESERKPVALSVVETSGELVRSTRYSEEGTHAQDYLEIVRKRAGNITGMGVRYGEQGLSGSRIFDFELFLGTVKTRLYSLLKYDRFTLLVFGEARLDLDLPSDVNVIQISSHSESGSYWAEECPYREQVILVRPDSTIDSACDLDAAEISELLSNSMLSS
ncbi:MAG: FAD-binding protein [Cryobacterium sp.]|nr:FAD-binding protein [Oligoflexia bacterium]